MKKYIYDKSNGLWYEYKGDCYFPLLSPPEEDSQSIGVWGWRHLRYIKEYHPALYNSLVLSGKLHSYLAEIDQQAQECLDTITQQTVRVQGITEELKTAVPLAWVGKMNSIRCAAEEIVNAEIIYA